MAARRGARAVGAAVAVVVDEGHQVTRISVTTAARARIRITVVMAVIRLQRDPATSGRNAQLHRFSPELVQAGSCARSSPDRPGRVEPFGLGVARGGRGVSPTHPRTTARRSTSRLYPEPGRVRGPSGFGLRGARARRGRGRRPGLLAAARRRRSPTPCSSATPGRRPGRGCLASAPAPSCSARPGCSTAGTAPPTGGTRRAGNGASRRPGSRRDVLYAHDGNGSSPAPARAAGIDACLHLVRRGARRRRRPPRLARRMVVPPHRDGGQAQFIAPPVPTATPRRPALEPVLSG